MKENNWTVIHIKVKDGLKKAWLILPNLGVIIYILFEQKQQMY